MANPVFTCNATGREVPRGLGGQLRTQVASRGRGGRLSRLGGQNRQ